MCKLLIKRFQLWHQYPAGQIIFFKKSSKIEHDIFGNVISVEGVGDWVRKLYFKLKRNSRDLLTLLALSHHLSLILAPGVLPSSPTGFLSRAYFHINNPACCHKIGYSKFQDIPSPSQTHKSGCWKEICSHSGWGFLGKLKRKSRPYVRS